jgi:hypothetical protein
MDPDAEFSIVDGVLMITFCGDHQTILKTASGSTCCIDVRVDFDGNPSIWVHWEEATDDEIKAAQVFRYTVLV